LQSTSPSRSRPEYDDEVSFIHMEIHEDNQFDPMARRRSAEIGIG
jgi:hypothetical protein